MQWNDRFRDDIRGFLRAEPGMVPAVMQRIAGSPDLFGGDTWRSVNFVTAHDGLTLHDLTSVTSTGTGRGTLDPSFGCSR
jgi:glycogen operon protein